MVLLLGEHTLFSCSARSTSRNTLGHCVIENPWCRPQFLPRHIHRPWLPPFLSGILSLFPSPLKRCCCWCCCSSSYTYFGPNSFHCKGLLSTHPLISLIYLNSSPGPSGGGFHIGYSMDLWNYYTENNTNWAINQNRSRPNGESTTTTLSKPHLLYSRPIRVDLWLNRNP